MDFTFSVFEKTRGFFASYLEQINLEDLNKIPAGFNNNIIWNIGHCVVTQQILVYKLSGLPTLVSEDLINVYKKGTKPERQATQEDVEILNHLLLETIDKTKTDCNNKKFVNFQEYTLGTTGNTLFNVEEALEFALFHEGLHLGVVMSLLKAIKL
ncbi:DinB family protein [Formosa haliotis]|uniref:DinB family protein n=1 Tax=Formosa haliotis TaxID=1555194 RepID=UPI000824E7CC|nr:DinB family protein [Formosa haliotis]